MDYAAPSGREMRRQNRNGEISGDCEKSSEMRGCRLIHLYFYYIKIKGAGGFSIFWGKSRNNNAIFASESLFGYKFSQKYSLNLLLLSFHA